MNKTPSSTIELTLEKNQDQHSQVTSNGERHPQRVSSRPRSAKEPQDTLKKLKIFPKRNQKNKTFSNQIISIKEKETQNLKITSKHEKHAKEDKKAKTSTDLKPTEKQKRKHELQSTTSLSLSNRDHHHKEKLTHKNDTTTNSNSTDAICSDDDSTLTTKTRKVNKVEYQHISNNNDCSKRKKIVNDDKEEKTSTDFKPTEKQKRRHKLESTTSLSLSENDHHQEEKPTQKNDTTPNSNSINVIFSDDHSIPTTTTSRVNKSKHQHISTNTKRTKTKHNVNEDANDTIDEKNTKTDTVPSVGSSFTDSTTMISSTDFITVKPEQNEPNIEDAVDESKKSNCIWWSIVSGIGGCILLFIVYYFGKNMLKERIMSQDDLKKNKSRILDLTKKCEQDIDIYLNQIPLGFNYWESHQSIETSFQLFEEFNEQNTDTKCTLMSQSKRETIFKVKLKEKHREKIDEFFLKYAEQMTIENLKLNFWSAYHLTRDFPKLQYFYEEKLNYPPLTKYFQQKKTDLKGNQEMIPAQVTLTDISNDSFNGQYKLGSFESVSNTPVYLLHDPSRKTSMKLKYCTTKDQWEISETDGYHYWIELKNTKDISYPGQLNTEKVIYVENGDKKKTETLISNLKMTTQLFLE